MYLLSGILGFLLCGLFDLNQIRWQRKAGNLLFPLGSLLILGGTLGCLAGLPELEWTAGRILLLSGALFCLAGLIYALFFALPFEATYASAGKAKAAADGIYGLCRHPGFWPFAGCYGFLAALTGTGEMTVCSLTFIFADFLYICLQDRYFFPRYLSGYREYREQVPFLLPDLKRLRAGRHER